MILHLNCKTHLVTLSLEGVCVSGSWIDHSGQWAWGQCWRGDARFICTNCHRHHYQSGPAVDGTADPHLLSGLWTERVHWHVHHDPAGVTG